MLLLEELVSSTRPDSSLIISQTLFYNDTTVTIRLRYFLFASFFLTETCSDMKGELVEKKTHLLLNTLYLILLKRILIKSVRPDISKNRSDTHSFDKQEPATPCSINNSLLNGGNFKSTQIISMCFRR